MALTDMRERFLLRREVTRLARFGHPAIFAVRSLTGGKRTSPGQVKIDANDLKRTSGVISYEVATRDFRIFANREVIGFYRHAAAGFHRIAWWGDGWFAAPGARTAARADAARGRSFILRSG